MSLLQIIRMAVHALLRNKTRSLLTSLGIIIGVSAVIAMVAIGEGAKARVQKVFQDLGNNLIIVTSGSTRSGGAFGGAGSQPTLTWDDLRAIRQEVPTVRRAAPVTQAQVQITSVDQNWSTGAQGVTPDYFPIRNWQVARGRFFTDSEVDAATKMVVLGRTVADKLFGSGADPVGASVRIKNIPFAVIGVALAKGQSPMGQDYDDAVFIPISTFRTKIRGSLQNFIPGIIMVEAVTAESAAQCVRQLTNLLRDRHRIQPGDEDDFAIRNLSELFSAQQEGTRTLTTLLAAIAAVSLLVGGIGIMNIMLVSVTERTREIGLRMAVGAKPRNILSQFLVEALALSLVGGLIGVALGIGAAFWLSQRFGWSLLVRPDIVAISLGFSAAVGIFFGLYPAFKASRLDPIEALRHE
ncbi:MAG: ABC transporter permease [Candidatus Lambdaproteobacteria bacterium]|nr:ABC transporter permease [Candidatus Lambdaproteobacteria bacterium]